MGKKSAKRVTNFLGTSAMTRPLFMLGAASVLLGTGPAHALDANTLPQNPNVVGGKDGFSQSGNTLNVNQSTKRTVIDWRSFDIGSKAQVNFNQPGTNSIAVNRVNASANASQIEGGLHANGQVWILNPNGVFFGKTAHVDAAGVVASTANIDANAFMAGSNKLQMTGADHGSVENQGNITVGANGLAAFVAPSVRNSGTINATVGRVALAAGTTYTLDLAGDHLVELGLGSVKAVVDNSGKIVNPGGTIALTAKAAGQVVNSVVNVSGVVSASSVTKSGGTITLGGDNVTTTSTAQLSADAGTNGNGGSITSVANVQGNYAGSFSAKGGSASGNGGSVETSGKNVHVDDSISVDTRAPNGILGNWTVDPIDISIVAGGDDSDTTGADGSITVGSIEHALDTTSLTISTEQGDGGSGDISLLSSINATGTGNLTLTGRHLSETGGSTINLAGALTLNVNAVSPLSDTTGSGNWISDALGMVGGVTGGTTINLGAGIYAAGTTINKASVTIDGGNQAEIATAKTQTGFTISANDVTIKNLEIAGPYTADNRTVDWNATDFPNTTGITIGQNVTGFDVEGNNIHDLRTGILINGTGNTGSVTDNTIENTKGAVLVQYTDGTGVSISGNKQGQFGNEWGVVLHLNTGTPVNSAAPDDRQALILSLSKNNNDWTVLDREYQLANRSSVFVDDDSTATAVDDFSYGNGLGNERQPLKTIQSGVYAVVAGGTVNVAPGTYNENVTVNKAGITLLSEDGAAATTIVGQGNTSLGAVVLQADDTTLGDTGHGFTILGIDNQSPGIESAAVYIQGPNSGSIIRGNTITANGDEALLTEYSGHVSSLTIDNNIFNGYTFAGANPAGQGSGQQFTLANVPRQLVVIGGGTGGGNTSNITFTRNQILGTAGGLNTSGQEQGNTLVTIDTQGGTITDNLFAGTTDLWSDALRARGTNTLISGNTFDATHMGMGTSMLEVYDSALTDSFSNVVAANVFNNGAVWFDHSVPVSTPGYTDYYVFRGINTAITNATPGDAIYVGDGTYNESVNVNKANLTLQSVNLHGAVIDAGNQAFGISIANNAGNLGTITIDGFTVQDWNTGGIIQGMSAGPYASMRVTNNLVYGPNTGAVANGNGIEVTGDGSIVSGNEVHNVHLNSVDWSGSGIIVANGSNITVEDNIVDGADSGIAVTNWDNTNGMSNISIVGNHVSNASDEGISVQAFEGAYSGVATGAISGLTITGNTVSDSASGLGIWDYSGYTFTGGVSAETNPKTGDFATTVANISGNTFSNNTYQISTDFTGADLTSAYGSNTFDAAAFNATSKNTIYGDLQTAVDEASPGDTLDVKGTFTTNNQIEVSQDLSIVGDAANKALFNVGRDFVGTNAASAWLLVDAGIDFNLSNVVMDGAGHQVTQALRSEGNTTVDGVDFRNIASNGYLGFAIASFGGYVAGGMGADSNGLGSSGSQLIVTNSTFNNIGRDGILIKGDGAFAQITNNVYTGKGAGDHLDYGIEVGAGGFAEITGNTITNALGVASTDGSTSAGIEVTTYYGTPTVAIIKQNIVTGNTVAVDVGYDDPSTSADDDNDTSDVVAFGNNFSGNGVELESNNATADFRGNYWGTTNDSAILASMTGLRAASVDFSTYLTTGTDTSTATGFQGNFSNVTVTTLGGGTDRIAGAEQFALTGGTINVKAGTYAEDVTVGTQYAFNFNNVTVNSFTVDSAGAGTAVNGDLTATGAIALNGATTVDGVLTAASFTSNATLALTGDLTTSGAAALNGASNITGDVTVGSLTTGGSLALAGDLVAANGITLGGASSIVGDVSGKRFTANGTLALNGDLSATGAAQFNGDTSVNGDVTAASITAAKAFALNGEATASGAITANGATKLAGKLTGGSIALNGATTLTGNTTLDTSAANGTIATAAIDGTSAGAQSLTVNAGSGNVSLGNLGATTRLGAVSDASKTTLTGSTYDANSFLFGGDVTLTSANTTLNTTQSSSAAGDITFQGDLFGTTDGGQSLTLIAGPGTGAASANGDITLQNAGTTATNLNNMTVSGNNFTALTVDLAGNYTSQLTGNQVFAADTLNVKGNATSNVGGDASGHIVAGGDVTIVAGGDVSGTISGQNVTLTGDDVNTDVTAVDSATITGNTVEGSYNADTVTLVASNNVDAAVNATDFTLSAQNGSVDGTWTTIDASGSGVVNVNGQTTVGLADVNPNQLVVEGFVLPAGTTIGANGQLILPQGVLLGLLSPGGGKPKMILVHSVQQLGELLASGYSVIVIDLSNRDSGKPIQLASN